MGRKNNSMDISSYKRTRLHARRRGHDYESTKNNIRTNYIKAKIDHTQQNSKCRLCREKYKTINCIVSEWGKQVQKEFKIWHDWLGMVIHKELCKRLNVDHTTKWYMHKPESVQENETHKILRNFVIQKNHLIPTKNLTWW